MRFVSPFAWIFTFFLILFVYTKLFGPISFSINSVTTTKSQTFDVVGEGKVSVVPDSASVNVGTRATGPTVKAAQDQMNASINSITSAVKALGVDAKDIQTLNYSLNPDYDFSSGTQKVKGYQASSIVQIKTHQTDKINAVIDAATSSGANEVSGVTFEVSDKTKAENQAREKAVADAKTKAQAAAKIAGFRLGRIVNYSENMGGNYPRPIPMAAGLERADAQKTQVEPGSNDIIITVSLSYEIQ